MMLSKVVTAGLVLVCAASALAVPVVDFNPGDDWVVVDNPRYNPDKKANSQRSWAKSSGDFDGDGTSDDSRGIMSFSETEQLSPLAGVTDWGTGSRTVNAVTSGVFYGGAHLTLFNDSGNPPTIGTSQTVSDDQTAGTPDTWKYGDGEAGGGRTRENYIATVWLKDDFLNGGDAGAMGIDANDALSVSITDSFYGEMNLSWLVKVGGNWYISEETHVVPSLDFDDEDFAPVASTGLTSTNWASIDLATAVNATPGTYGSLDLTDIQGVGYYIAGDDRYAPMLAFSADMVPEPTTMAVLGLGVIGLIKRRR